jgi:hypothetical protein
MSKNMKSTIEDVRRDIAGLASAMRRVAIAVTGIDARLIRLQEFAHKELVTRTDFNARMDGFSGALKSRPH